jgi:hypothetical protein
MIGWGGLEGWEAGRRPIDSAYTYTEPVLAAWGIPYVPLMSDDDIGTIEEMDRTAAATSMPSAVLTGYPFLP